MNSSPKPAGLALLALSAVCLLDTCRPTKALEDQNSNGENLKFELRLLREDFQEERTKLRRKLFLESERRIKLEKQLQKLKDQIGNLQQVVNQIETDRVFPQGFLSKSVTDGLAAQKAITKQTKADLRQLKVTVKLNLDEISSLKQSTSQNYTELRTSLMDLRQNQSLCACSTGGQRRSKEITVPRLRFIQTDDPAVVVEMDGLVARERFTLYRSEGISVHTDGRLTAGLQYWEVGLMWRTSLIGLPVPDGRTVASIRVRQQGSDFSTRLGSDDKSWAVEIQLSTMQNDWRYQFVHDGVYYSETTPVTIEDRSIINHLGFLLDAADQTLTVVDLNNNNNTFSFSDVNLSRPLVPSVWSGQRWFERTFQLLVDPTRLPKPVFALSQT